MTRSRRAALFAAVALFAGAAGYGFNYWRTGGGDAGQPGAAEALMAIRLADLNGERQSLSQWRGKVLVVNFWATWCTPCREEIPMFVRAQDKYRAQGLQFIGIAIDQPDNVRAFSKEFSINYPLLIGGMEAVALSRLAGNRIGALPFTIVMDRKGKLAATQLGELKEARLDAVIRPHL